MGRLYLIPTPLSDDQPHFLLPQEREMVQKVNTFIVENPKTARKYLKLLDTETPLQQLEFFILDEHTSDKEVLKLAKLMDNQDVGLMSEAGAPGVADPGSKLVRLAHRKNIEVIPLVGPSSILLALMSSGLNGQTFAFKGYLPIDQKKRANMLRSLEKESQHQKSTQIFMETPYRNRHVWKSLLSVCDPTTQLAVAVNLTAKDQYIMCASINDWKSMKWPDLDKKPAIFMIQR